LSDVLFYKEYKVLKGILYTRTHEWIKVEDKKGIVGITDYAQKKLRDIVYVEEPEIGKRVKRGEVLTVVESVKAVGEIYAPVSGTIVGWNERLSEDPSIVSTDPYGEGWIVALEIENREELKELLNAEEYIKVLEEEESSH